MPTLYDEAGISLAKNGAWIGLSHEIEFEDGSEIRKLGWKIRGKGAFKGPYLRIWIGKRVVVLDKKGFKTQKKGKWALKAILGFEYAS